MAAVSVGTAKVRQAATVSLSAHSNTTAYVVAITHPSGAVEKHTVTTDGSGAATVTYVPQEPGTATVTTTPAASTTTATTTATHSAG